METPRTRVSYHFREWLRWPWIRLYRYQDDEWVRCNFAWILVVGPWEIVRYRR